MPCDTSHMKPTELEKILSQVACLIDELDGAKIDANRWLGNHPRVYNAHLSEDAAGALIRELCQKIQEIGDISQCSLELQIWWRDHQATDGLRNSQKKMEAEDRISARNRGLAKLTDDEKKALGLDRRFK